MTIERIEKRFKQATCNHSAYKRLPIWGGLLYSRWHQRWLAIAEKLKPNSTAQ